MEEDEDDDVKMVTEKSVMSPVKTREVLRRSIEDVRACLGAGSDKAFKVLLSFGRLLICNIVVTL